MDSRIRAAWLTSSIATLALLSLGSGCIVGFKVETSTSATAGETSVDKNTVTEGSSSSGSTTDSDSGTGTDSGTDSGTDATGGTAATDSDSDGSTGTTTTGSTTVVESTGVETTGSTGGGDAECSVDLDCELFSDCCSCQGAPAGEVPAQCDLLCDTPRCEALGIAGATCRFGVCITDRINCDASTVECADAPPECPVGLVAQVTEKGDCWTGECVRGIHCNVVPSCVACPESGWSCVTNVDFVSSYRCEPIPAACEDAPTCGCAGDLYCDDVYSVCSEAGDGIHCECPDC